MPAVEHIRPAHNGAYKTSGPAITGIDADGSQQLRPEEPCPGAGDEGHR